MKKQLIVCGILLTLGVAGYQLKTSVASVGATKSVSASSNTSACLAVGSGFESMATQAKGNSHQQILIPSSAFIMGNNNGYPEELTEHEVTVAEFSIDIHEVTNSQFAVFVEKTGYVTTAERAPDPANYPDVPPELLVAGSAAFVELDDRPEGGWREWWKFSKGANWRQPQGEGSDLSGLENYPVVHVSYQDAASYAKWAGRALPTEAQWELAAQASIELEVGNTWQGHFPLQDKALDGFAGIAPVGCYPPDSSGLFDMKGNVWELVSDVYEFAKTDPSLPPTRVIKGGSFLCSDNYCQRDRPQARQGQEEDFSTSHVGFRTVSASK